MSPRAQLRLISLSVILALLFSAVVATPASADDGVPPAEEAVPAEEGGDVADPAGEQAEPPEGGDAGTDTATAEAIPPAESEQVDAGAAPTEALPADAAGAELLSESPDGTTIVVVGEEGVALPLASEEAAEILATGDPIWCPASITVPVAGLSGCSPSQPSLWDMFEWLKINEPAADGVVWVEGGVDGSGAALVLNGSAETTLAQFRLTIKGGWNGLGTNTIDPTNPSAIGVQLRIANWLNDITISDLWISGVAATPALEVTTTGKVTLTRVHVRSNTGAGAVLDNDAGVADMLITLGDFCKNPGGTGLYAVSRGTITLAGLIAESNGGGGAYVSNAGAATAKNVVMTTGDFAFNNNGLEGLAVYS